MLSVNSMKMLWNRQCVAFAILTALCWGGAFTLFSLGSWIIPAIEDAAPNEDVRHVMLGLYGAVMFVLLLVGRVPYVAMWRRWFRIQGVYGQLKAEREVAEARKWK